MSLSKEHRQKISDGLRRQWKEKRQIQQAKQAVIDAARQLAAQDISDENARKSLEELRLSLKEHDELAGH